ncbi:hypothetical protein ACUH7Y_09705 [Clostridium beijerinckii]|uniref:Uncharacterized protein n=1 Tax=Clostridium beijerinckii TaxID=1520 RepID=A0A7X9SME2_CLOBE|nr:hypothetical protein [Clostridium beijerinckii]NMF04586.1 hypothetical protein [Clostridium beijerinckii]
MEIEQLKEQLKEGTFYYHKCGLLVKSEVNLVLEINKDILNVNFTGGCVDVYMDKIEHIRRPENIIAEFKWCYRLRNEYDECIGYIGKIEEII